MKNGEHNTNQRGVKDGQHDGRAERTVDKSPGNGWRHRMGCGKVKDGEHGGSERHQGKGDDVGDVGGVGGVDESLEMAGVVQKGCGKVNDGETAPAAP